VVYHFLGPDMAFFRRLKNQIHGSIEVAMCSQMPGCRQQHGGMAIMSASMHFPGMLAGMPESIGFLHGQRVHVCTKADRASIFGSAMYGADDPCNPQATMGLDSPRLQL